ncbi:LrgB family protein [Haloimpatiens sp. FM7330]|uniref:LrgB family protein n=1 Tax=Haloimpatiens sp. FM7330 TaxID=3298610 RepID=UPI00362A91E9
MTELINNPIFGIMISLMAFEIGSIVYKKTNCAIFNPLLIAITLIIIFLLLFNINFDSYYKGGSIINFFLAPSTIVLAVPLYKKIKLLKANAIPIICGILVGSSCGIITIFYLCKLFKLDSALSISLLPKSITTPIGIEISKQLGGIPPVTVAAIIITGIMGAVIGPFVCKLFRIKDKVAVGISIGTASHAVGTTKAMELGETEGAMSGLAIGIAGLMTVFLAPLLLKILS